MPEKKARPTSGYIVANPRGIPSTAPIITDEDHDYYEGDVYDGQHAPTLHERGFLVTPDELAKAEDAAAAKDEPTAESAPVEEDQPDSQLWESVPEPAAPLTESSGSSGGFTVR